MAKKKEVMKRNQTRIDILMALNDMRKDTELAESLGMSPQALYSKLSGEISMKTIELLATFFKVPVKEMFK